MQDLDFFLDLERRVWQALLAGDAAADAALLSSDFLGVYETGFSGRDGHAGQLADGPTVARFHLSQARLIELGPGLALLAYRADYTRAGAPPHEVMYVSSIWREAGGNWINIFSQDTPQGDGPPV